LIKSRSKRACTLSNTSNNQVNWMVMIGIPWAELILKIPISLVLRGNR
jgi:hypothetical protein